MDGLLHGSTGMRRWQYQCRNVALGGLLCQAGNVAAAERHTGRLGVNPNHMAATSNLQATTAAAVAVVGTSLKGRGGSVKDAWDPLT